MELLLVVLAIIVIWFVVIYNRLTRMGSMVQQARANILASMKKRSDLVGRLIDIAKSYGEHEKLTQVATSKNLSSLSDTMSALSAAFPELKANATYQQLMGQLEQIEGDLQKRRESYNAAVGNYNSYRQALPQGLFATAIGFKQAEFFAVDDNGMDVLPEFRTDDGEALKKLFADATTKAGAVVLDARDKVTAIADARSAKTPE